MNFRERERVCHWKAKSSTSIFQRLIRFQGIDGSLVNFHAFSSPVPGEGARLLLACEASGRGPESEVLVGALAAGGSLANGSIDDGGHHWLDRDCQFVRGRVGKTTLHTPRPLVANRLRALPLGLSALLAGCPSPTTISKANQTITYSYLALLWVLI